MPDITEIEAQTEMSARGAGRATRHVYVNHKPREDIRQVLRRLSTEYWHGYKPVAFKSIGETPEITSVYLEYVAAPDHEIHGIPCERLTDEQIVAIVSSASEKPKLPSPGYDQPTFCPNCGRRLAKFGNIVQCVYDACFHEFTRVLSAA